MGARRDDRPPGTAPAPARRSAAFCRSLEPTLGHPAQANAYYTPRGSQGLPVHHDTHDVFVLQVAGEKRWLVYEPALELPLRNQKYTAEMGEPGTPVHDLVLRPGDMLYLPRGWLHEALTSDSDSLHLTVGVNVVTWLDAFKAALEECGDEPGFRRSIGDGGVDELVDALRGRLTADAVERRAAEKLARTRRPIRDGQLSQLRAIEELDVDTEVELRETVLVHASERNGSIELTFDGKEVAFPARIQDEVSWFDRSSATAVHGRRICPGDLDDESRLVLVRRLVREGFCSESARHNDVATGPPRHRRATGEERELAGLLDDVDLARPYPGLETHRPTVIALARHAGKGEIREPGQTFLGTNAPLRRLDVEWPARAAAVPVERELPREMVVEDVPHVVAVDPTVVDAVGECDEIPGEPVAADVGALPRGRLVQLFADSLPERSPVPRAAAVVLSVRAHEKERLVELLGGFEGVDPAKLLVLLHFEAGKSFVPHP